MQVTNWLRGYVYRFGHSLRRRRPSRHSRFRRRGVLRSRRVLAMAWAPEPLEQRTLLAATAVFDSPNPGDLTITDDTGSGLYTLRLTADNMVEFTDGITVEGTFGPVTGTLTFNGGNAPLGDEILFDFNGFSLDATVVINTLGGDDVVTIVNDMAPAGGVLDNSLTVNLGADDDDVVITDISVTGNVAIDAGDGDNNVSIGFEFPGPAAPVAITGDLMITSGSGDDDVYIAETSADDVTVNTGNAVAFDVVDLASVTTTGNIGITTGSGDDGVYLYTLSAGGSVTINTGDATGLLNEDLVDIEAAGVMGDLAITTGNGNDEIFLAATDVTGDVTITSGAGNDSVTLGASYDGTYLPVGVDGNLTIHAGDSTTVNLINTYDQTTVAGDVTITSGTGNLQITGGDGIVSTGGSIDVSLAAAAVDVLVGAPLTANVGDVSLLGPQITVNATVSALAGDVTLTADEMLINAANAVSAAAGVVTLQQLSAGQPISLAPLADVPGDLNVTLTELNRVTAGVVRIGDAANTGDITIRGLLVNIMNFDTLALQTAGAIVDNSEVPGFADIEIENLALQGTESIGVGGSGGTLETDVLNLAFASNGAVNITNNGALTISGVDQLTTSSAGGGSVTAASPLTIATDVNLSGSFTFTAGNSNAAGDDLAITNDRIITLNSGTPSTLTLNAGDDIIFGDATNPAFVVTMGAGHTVVLNADLETGSVADGDRGSVTQTQSGTTSVAAQTLEVNAADGIGTTTRPFVFDAGVLSTDSDADQFLSEQNVVDIGSIDAGAADVHLRRGTFLNDPVTASDVLVGGGGDDATLGGTGTISAAVAVLDSGTIAPGASPSGAGILNTGNLDLDDDTPGGTDPVYAVEIGGAAPGIGGHDQISVAGTVRIEEAELALDIISGFTATVGQEFVIISNDGADAISGPGFNGLAEGGIITAGGQAFQITYMGGTDDNDVVLTRVAFASGADLQVTKADSPDEVNPGEQITYTITVTNNGPFAADDVQLTDMIPAGTTLVSFTQTTGAAWTLDTTAPSVGGTVASLPVGASATFTLVVLVDANSVATSVSNTATVTSTTADPNPAPNNSATETTDITPPDFDFGDAPTAAQSGLAASYPTLDADSGAKHVVVPGTPFLGSVGPDLDPNGQPSATATGDDTDVDGDDEDGVTGLATPLVADDSTQSVTVTANGAGLLNAWIDFNRDGDWDDAGEQIASDQALATGAHTVSFTVPASASLGTTFARFRYSTAGGDAPTGRAEDGEVEDHVVTIVPPIPLVDLVLTKSQSAGPVIAGGGAGNLTYTVTLTNSGMSDAEDIVIDEDLTLPTGVTVVSVTPSLGTFAPTGPGPDGTWTIDALPAGQSQTLTVVLTAGASTAHNAVISNTASVDSISQDQLLINTGDDAASANTTVQRQVDLVVTKTDSPDPAIAGTGAGNLTYTINVSNAGPSDASGVVLSEDLTLPAGVSLVSITPSAGTTFAPTTAPDGTWTVGNLARGGSATLTVVLTVSATAPDDALITNTAAVTATNEARINTGNDSDTESTTIQNELSGLAVSGSESVNEGGTATLTASFLNEPKVHSVTINWGDGQSTSFTLPAGTFDFQRTHQYLDDDPSGTPQDPFTVKVTVTDEDGAMIMDSSKVIIVRNVPPVFTSLALNPTTVPSGGQTTVTGTYSDPGGPDTHLIDLDTDDDGVFETTSIPVSGGAFSFNVAINRPPGAHEINLRIRDDDGGSSTATRNVTVSASQQVVVQESRLFYNNSSFDGANAAGNAADVAAIDTTKASLTLGQAATFANVSGYSKGLNGVSFLVSALPADGANLTPADFAVRVGTTNNVNSWAAGPAASVTVLANSGPGGADRILLTFADNAIDDTYAAFQILANANTGLAATHTAIFGNVRGETGAAFVGQGTFFGRDAADLQLIAGDLFETAAVASVTDVTKDGVVNAFDLQVIPVASTEAVGGAFQSNVLPVITPGFAAAAAPGVAQALSLSEVDPVGQTGPAGTFIGPIWQPTPAEDGRVAATEPEYHDLAFALFGTSTDSDDSDLFDDLATARLTA